MKRLAILVGTLLSICPEGRTARADPRFEVPPPREAEAAPASRYASLSNDAAFAELGRRQIPFERVSEAPGVRAPIRLSGKLRGVSIHSSLPEAEWKTTPFEILDARLALALDDFADVLWNHDVVELIHFTIYRPPGRDANDGGLHRHPGGMAIDVGALRKRGGALLVVAQHWAPGVGARTCGDGARRLPIRRGRELVSLVCEAADLRLFHSILTPHHDRAHRDHLHLEIKPDTPWFLVR